jgi:hypothetical protein
LRFRQFGAVAGLPLRKSECVGSGHHSTGSESDLAKDSDRGFPKLAGCASLGMREGIPLTVDAADCARLGAIVADRNRPQKCVRRAWTILLTVDGFGTAGIERQTGKDKTNVRR